MDIPKKQLKEMKKIEKIVKKLEQEVKRLNEVVLWKSKYGGYIG